MAYQEFTFELEPETCSCQSSIRSQNSVDKKTSRHEIRRILCATIDNMLSNDISDDLLINNLQNILINLEETKTHNLNEVEDLIEEHTRVGLSKNIIKKRLLEIAENIYDYKNDGTYIKFKKFYLNLFV